jgi:nicotinamide riboside kinase
VSDWRSHFYTYLQPQLEHLITEQRYELSAFDQERLTAWLNDQKRRLESHAAVPAPEK